MYYNTSGTIQIEEDDQCISCEHFCKGIACPLLESLAVGVCVLKEDTTVVNCGFYRKFKRRLQVVE